MQWNGVPFIELLFFSHFLIGPAHGQVDLSTRPDEHANGYPDDDPNG
mgnify:CR=1 FL=1